jgi:DNA-binding IclR family transcriptional regulator
MSMPITPSQRSGVEAEESAVAYATPALEKGLDILELLAHQRDGLTKSEVARGLGRTVSEVFRMLLCLERRGYILLAASDRYVLSLRLFQLVQEHPPTERLLSEALPRMHDFAADLQQSCHLGVLEAECLVILAQVNAPNSVGFYVKPGSSVDLMEAATAQTILAYQSKDARHRILDEWCQRTGGRLPSDLDKRLDRIRRRGYEKRASYQVRGITNISFPIKGVGALAVAGLTVPYIQRLRGGSNLTQIETGLRRVANEISSALGSH